MNQSRWFVHIAAMLLFLMGQLPAGAQEMRHFTPLTNSVQTDSLGLLHLVVDECNGYSSEEGFPQLPVYRELFWGGESAAVEIVDDSFVEVDVEGEIFPVQPVAVKGRSTAFASGYLYEENTAKYSQELIRLRRIGIRGQRTLWMLEISPVEYLRSSHKLLIHSVGYRLAKDDGYVVKNQRSPKYEIVVPSALASGIEPLAAWRRQCGYEVGVMESDNLSKDTIRARLKREWPDYVLIVGDIQDISSFSAKHNIAGLNSHYTDLYFGEYTNDYLPEALVGRLPVSDTATLRSVVDKIIRYEMSPDSVAIGRALTVAGEEGQAPAPTTTNGQVNYVSLQLSSVVDTVCFRNPESNLLRDSILSVLQQGFGIVNYTSHCDVYGWKRPDLTASDIDTAGTYAGLWINNCCESNRFAGDCFGELLLLLPQGGAVGVIGAGNETLWIEDYLWSVGAKRPISLMAVPDPAHMGAFDQLVSGEVSTFGEILFSGNMAVTESGSVNDAFYWEVYCLIGDPASRVSMGDLDPLTLYHDSLSVGMVSVGVGSEAGALVTVVQQGRLIGRGQIPSSGFRLLSLTEPLEEGVVLITATKPFRTPVVDTINPIQVSGSCMALKVLNPSHTITIGGSDTMWVRCCNLGGSTALSPRIVLVQDTLSGQPLCFRGFELTLDSMTAGASDTLAIPLSVGETHLRELMLQLGVGDAGDNLVWQPVVWEVGHPELELSLLLTQNGSPVGRVMPNESYCMLISAHNVGQMADMDCPVRISVEMVPGGDLIVFDTTLSVSEEVSDTLRFSLPMTNPLQGLFVEVFTSFDTVVGWWQAGIAVEDFEEGLHYPWHNASLHPWQIDSTVSHNGRYSMRSGMVEHSEHTDLELEVDIADPDTLGFWMKISTESDKDRLSFYLDGERLNYWSGQKDWKYWKTSISSGHHLLRWTYAKDGSNSQYSDCVWIDDVRLPGAVWDTLCGNGTLVYDTTTWVGSIEEPIAVKIYPNPACDFFVIESDVDMAVDLFDMVGRKVSSFEHRKQFATQYSTQELRYGTYLVKCTSSRGSSVQRLIVIH